MDVYVYVETERGTATDVARAIADLDVRAVVVVTGPWDVIVSIEGIDPGDVDSTVLDEIQGVSGVVRTNTQIVVELESSGSRAADTPVKKPFRPPVNVDTEVAVLVHVLIDPGTAGEVQSQLIEADVDGLALLAGDWDFLVEVVAASWEDAMRKVLEKVQPIPEIVRTSTNLIVLKLKGKGAEKGEAAAE